MAKDKIIPNALELAQLVGKCILEESYQYNLTGPQKMFDGVFQIDMIPERRNDSVYLTPPTENTLAGQEIVKYEEQAKVYSPLERIGVHDVLLFGSTLRGEAHDIDMVIIHNNRQFEVYESALKYEKGRQVVDFDCKVDENMRYLPSTILRELMGKNMYTHDNSQRKIRDYFKHVVESVVEQGKYSGEFLLDYIDGPVTFSAQNKDELEQELDMLYHYLTEGKVNTTVNKMFNERGLKLNGDLDLLMMSKKALSIGGREHRNMLIDLCRDSTFWYTVLSEGRLYNHSTEKFDLLVEQKYPGVLGLFKR